MLGHKKLGCFVLFCECGGSALFVHLRGRGRAAISSSARFALFPLLYQGNVAFLPYLPSLSFIVTLTSSLSNCQWQESSNDALIPSRLLSDAI